MPRISGPGDFAVQGRSSAVTVSILSASGVMASWEAASRGTCAQDLNESEVIYQCQSDGSRWDIPAGEWFIESYNVHTGGRRILRRAGADYLAARANRWIAWHGGLFGAFGPLPLASTSPVGTDGRGAAGRDGTLAVTTNYQAGGPIELVPLGKDFGDAGNVQIPNVYGLHLAGPLAQDASWNGMAGLLPGARDPIKLMVQGKVWWVYATDRGLLAHPDGDRQHGRLIEPLPRAFHPDATVTPDDRIAVVYSVTVGENPDDLVYVPDVRALPVVDLTQAVVLPFGRQLCFGAFFSQSDRPGYGNIPEYPENCTVVVEPTVVARAATKCKIIIAAKPELYAAVQAANVAHRVLGLYIVSEEAGGGAPAAEQLARQAKQQWIDRFGSPVPPVVWYVTPAEANRADWMVPPTVDLPAPELYFTAGAPLAQLEDELRSKLVFWLQKLGMSKRWLPICQAYDRRYGLPGQGVNMDEVAAFQPSYLDSLRRSDSFGVPIPADGLLFFAVCRPGGSKTYPPIASAHRSMFAALPPGLPPLPSGGTPVLPPKFTISDPKFPQNGQAPLAVRCEYALEAGSGPVEWIEWQVGASKDGPWSLSARNPGDDHDHTYRFTSAGNYWIKARATNAAGSHETGAERKVIVSKPVDPPVDPPTGEKVWVKTGHGDYLSTKDGLLVHEQKKQAFIVEPTSAPGVVALWSNSRYAATENDLRIKVDRTSVGSEWEKFSLGLSMSSGSEGSSSVVTFKSMRTGIGAGYLSARDDGSVLANQPVVGGLERYTLEPATGGGGGGGGPLPRLRQRGRFFELETGEHWTEIQCSDFSLYKRFLEGEDITPILSQRQEIGFNTLRVWVLNQSVVGLRDLDKGRTDSGIHPHQYPDFYSRLTEFMHRCGSFGLRVEITAFTSVTGSDGLMPDDGDQHRHWDATIAALQPCTNALLEKVNEADQYNNRPSANLQRPSGVISSNGSNGADSDPERPTWDYERYHTNGLPEFQRKVGHNAMEHADTSGVPCGSNENTRYPDQDANSVHAEDAAEGASLLCMGCCYHSQAGKYSRLFEGTELDCARAWVAGARSVPLEFQDGAYHHRTDLEGGNVIRGYDRQLGDGRRHEITIRA